MNPRRESRRVWAVRLCGMRPGVTIVLSAVDRRRLEAIVGNRNASQKHAWRAEIVLLSAGSRRRPTFGRRFTSTAASSQTFPINERFRAY